MAEGIDCKVGVTSGIDCEVGVAAGIDCEVGVAEGIDCEVGVASTIDCEVGVVAESDCDIGVAVESDCEVGMETDSKCTVLGSCAAAAKSNSEHSTDMAEDGREGMRSEFDGVVLVTNWRSGEREETEGVGGGVSPLGTAHACCAPRGSTIGRKGDCTAAGWTRAGWRREEATWRSRGFWCSSRSCMCCRYCARSPSCKWEGREPGARRGRGCSGRVLAEET